MKKNRIIVSSTVIGIVVIGFASWQIIKMFDQKAKAAVFSSEIPGNAQIVTESNVIELKNGETYDLTASIVQKEINGQKLKMFAYNNSIPGPTIRVKQGSNIDINFKNNLDIPTTLHSHGVRVDNKFDGVPNITQPLVNPGESFTYKLKFSDPGVYWYHPHSREDYAQELGLYGNFIVEPTNPKYWNPVNREINLFVDDLLLENGKIAEFDVKNANHAIMGRFGNVMLVNGQTNYFLTVKTGEVVRFFITNSANARPFNLAIPGTKIKLVGGDNGRVSKEEMVDSILLGPSERAVVEILFDHPDHYQIVNQTTNNQVLGNIHVDFDKTDTSYQEEFQVLRKNILDNPIDLDAWQNKPADKELKLSLDMKMPSMNNEHDMNMDDTDQNMQNQGMMDHSMHNMDHSSMQNAKIEFEDTMGNTNKMSNASNILWKLIDQQTGKENMDINWQFKQGSIVKIKIFNDPNSMHPMQHPIHLHGQRFLVLKTNENLNQNPVWKDTVLIQTGDTAELLVDMSNLGDWMLHCHIPEHMESQMMLTFKVI